MFEIMRQIVRFVPAIASLVLLAPAVRASDISFVYIFGNQSYEQTGNGNTLSSNGDFFSADLITTTANPYTLASLTYPGPGSPQNLPQTSSTDYGFQTGLFPTLTAMKTAYPTGTYRFQGVNSPTTDTATLNYLADDYAAAAPYLTGTDYSSLQGMDASKPFTFTFNSYTPGTTASDGSYTFLTIYDVTTNTQAFTDGFLPSSSTSVVLPGGTLTPGDLYNYELDYSNRDGVSGAGAPNAPFIGFDMRTDGTFTTSSVPEPHSSALLLAAALLGPFIVRRRRNAAA